MKIDPKTIELEAMERAVMRDALEAYIKDRKAKAAKAKGTGDRLLNKIDTLERAASYAEDTLARLNALEF